MPVAVAGAVGLGLAWGLGGMRLGVGLDALGLFRLSLLGLSLGLGLLCVSLGRLSLLLMSLGVAPGGLGLSLLLMRLLGLSLGLLLMGLGVPLGGLGLHMLLAGLASRLIASASLGLGLLLTGLLCLRLGLLLVGLAVPLGGFGLHMLLAGLGGRLIAPADLGLNLLLAARFVLGAGRIRLGLLRAGLIDRLVLAVLHRRARGHAGCQRRGSLPLGAFLLHGRLLPARLIVLRPLVMPAAPVGVALLFGGPVALARQHGIAPRLPLRGLGGLALLMHGGGVDLARPGQVAGGHGDVARRDVLRHGAAG